MSHLKSKEPEKRSSDRAIAYVAVGSVLVVGLTLAVSSLGLELASKYLLLAPVLMLYLGFSYRLYRRERASASTGPGTASVFTSDIDGKLAALADANEFFGASLRPDDLFRLIASRLGDIVSFSTCVLHVRDQDSGDLRIRCAIGDNAQHFSSSTGILSRSLASRAVEEGEVVCDWGLEIERSSYPAGALEGLESATAVPLRSEGEVFGALVLYSNSRGDFEGASQNHLLAAAERVAPVIAGSFAFERSIDNALTDPVTGLPNERGFFLVLETRLAESHRFRGERGLAVLALDVAGFSDFNETFGHSMGNRLLNHIAEVAKGQLRQMDVITRSAGDEFLAVLPTGNEGSADEIVNRLRRAFDERPFEMDHGTSFAVNLNFGTATFGRDGDTAQALLQTARVKKQERKSKEGKVLFFPRDTVN